MARILLHFKSRFFLNYLFWVASNCGQQIFFLLSHSSLFVIMWKLNGGILLQGAGKLLIGCCLTYKYHKYFIYAFFPHLFTCCIRSSFFLLICRSRGCIRFHSCSAHSVSLSFNSARMFEHRQLLRSILQLLLLNAEILLHAALFQFLDSSLSSTEQRRHTNTMKEECEYGNNFMLLHLKPKMKSDSERAEKGPKRHKSFAIELLFIVLCNKMRLRYTCSFFDRMHFNHFIWTDFFFHCLFCVFFHVRFPFFSLRFVVVVVI